MRINIEFEDTTVRRALNRLLRAGRDLTPTMKEIADELEDGVLEPPSLKYQFSISNGALQ